VIFKMVRLFLPIIHHCGPIVGMIRSSPGNLKITRPFTSQITNMVVVLPATVIGPANCNSDLYESYTAA